MVDNSHSALVLLFLPVLFLLDREVDLFLVLCLGGEDFLGEGDLPSLGVYFELDCAIVLYDFLASAFFVSVTVSDCAEEL